MTIPFERLLIGRTLAERYRVDAVQGRGGMSVVFRATDLTLGREVAVKVVALPGTSEPEQDRLRERFRREAAAAAGISHHPAVVQVFDYGTDPELALDFIVMELLRGEDLRQRLARAAAPPLPEGIRILLETARGVAAGHAAGIVHRDVKPGNVFLLGSGEVTGVRVLDFGIAKPLGQAGDELGTLTQAGELPHSPAYASPEQLAGAGEVTPASDVYQLGLVAFETLTGQRPFTPEQRERIRAGEDPSLPAMESVPPAVEAVVRRALARDPGARFADAAAFAEALAEAARGGDAPAPSPVPVPAPAARRSEAATPWPAEARFAVVGAILLLAVLLWAGMRGGETPAAGTPGETSPLDSTFLALQGMVTGQSSAAGDAPAGVTAPTGAENLIRGAVHDLNRAWVEGDIPRHVGHYASRVDYFNSRRLPRAGVRRDRTRDLRRYAAMRRVDVGDIQVEFLAEDRARALVKKAWDLRGEGQTRVGRGDVEYVFKRDGDDGRWYVVSEQMLSQSEVRAPGTAPD